MKNLLFFAAIITMLSACSKDEDEPVYYPENPQTSFLAATGFNEDVQERLDTQFTEHGLKFKPTVSGVMTSITARIPKANTNLRVTIWDVQNVKPIRIIRLNAASDGVAVTQKIAALSLTMGKEYMISMNSRDTYKYQRFDTAPANYPVLTGNILITGYGYSYSQEQTMPSRFPTDYYCGDLTFAFQRTSYYPQPQPLQLDEKPMSKYVYNLGFDTNWRYTTHFGFHSGYAFRPNVNGKISALTVRVATVGTGKDAIVRLWDKTTGQLLISQDIDVPLTSEGIEFEMPVPPIELVTDHEYIITGSYQYVLHHFSQDNLPGNYPLTLGSIDFLNSVYKDGDGIPTNSIATSYDGDVGFVFRKTQ
jgi:WD40 repeat protein